MTNEDLLMLENLTYIDSEKFSDLNIPSIKDFEGCTVAQYLNAISDEDLENLEKSEKLYDGEIEGAEWAAMIRYMKNSSEISSLIIKDVNVVECRTIKSTNEKVDTICFEHPDAPEEAIVTFRGTLDGDEWADNIEGLNKADTENQREARYYIESLPYDDITVVGHSKGGNKAMYVAITSEKVTRCVSYDGQGFSPEFIEKYSVEIEERGHLITNYSLSGDFVNVLLYTLPGIGVVYVENGSDVNGVKQGHSPSSIFEYEYENGNLVVKTNEFGEILLPVTNDNNPIMDLLHELAVFIMDNAPEEQQNELIEIISYLVRCFIAKDRVFDLSEIDRHQAFLLLGYLVMFIRREWIETSVDEIYDLLKGAGLYYLLEGLLSKELLEEMGIDEKVDDIVKAFLDKILSLPDQGYLIILYIIGKLANYDISAVWITVKDRTKGRKASYYLKEKRIHDFSLKNRNLLLNAIWKFDQSPLNDISVWNKYNNEVWFSKLLIGLVIKCLKKYDDNIRFTNMKCKKNIEQAFSNAIDMDCRYGNRVNNINGQLDALCRKLEQRSNQLEI